MCGNGLVGSILSLSLSLLSTDCDRRVGGVRIPAAMVRACAFGSLGSRGEDYTWNRWENDNARRILALVDQWRPHTGSIHTHQMFTEIGYMFQLVQRQSVVLLAVILSCFIKVSRFFSDDGTKDVEYKSAKIT